MQCAIGEIMTEDEIWILIQEIAGLSDREIERIRGILDEIHLDQKDN